MKKGLMVGIIILAAVLLTAAAPSHAVAAGTSYHVVQPGETLSSIASMYGVSTWALANANGIWNWNYVYVGQVLVIPYGGYPTYVRYYYPTNHNYNSYYYPRPTYNCYYWVRYGDTMSGIAARYGADPWTLARAIGIYNLNWIYAGQRLLIPGCN